MQVQQDRFPTPRDTGESRSRKTNAAAPNERRESRDNPARALCPDLLADLEESLRKLSG
jgi:hypothetical protein